MKTMKTMVAVAAFLAAGGMAAAQEDRDRRLDEMRREQGRRMEEMEKNFIEQRKRMEHEFAERMKALRGGDEEPRREVPRGREEQRRPEGVRPPEPPRPPQPPGGETRPEGFRGGVEPMIRELMEQVQGLAREVEQLKGGGRAAAPGARSDGRPPEGGLPFPRAERRSGDFPNPDGARRPAVERPGAERRPEGQRPAACRCEGKCDKCHAPVERRAEEPRRPGERKEDKKEDR